MLKKVGRELVRLLGYGVYKREFTPKGLDWMWDIARLTRNNPVRTIIDCGANEGQTALALLRYFSDSTIYSFEPVGKTFDILRDRIAGHPNIVASRLALGTTPGVCRMAADPDASGLNHVLEKDHAGSSYTGPVEEVPMTTLQEFCTQKGVRSVDVLKTDTEGYDLNVIRGAGEILKSVRFVVSEVDFARDGSDSGHSHFRAIDDFLSESGFVFYSLGSYQHRQDGSVLYADALWLRPFKDSAP